MAGKMNNMPAWRRGQKLIKIEKWWDDMPGAWDKQTELIKMGKWQEKWTICLAPGTKTHKNRKMAGRYAWRWDKQTELIKIEKMAGKVDGVPGAGDDLLEGDDGLGYLLDHVNPPPLETHHLARVRIPYSRKDIFSLHVSIASPRQIYFC